MNKIKWLYDYTKIGERPRLFHLPVQRMPWKQTTLTVVFPICLLVLVYLLIKNVCLNLYLDLLNISTNWHDKVLEKKRNTK